jgi:hypothetical protein
MTTLRTALIALALSGAFPLPALAGPAPAAAGPALAAATRAYFDAVNTGDTTAFNRSISATFRVTLPDGTQLGSGDYIGGVLARQLDRSTPVQSVRIGPASIDGATATEIVDVSSWNNVMNGTRLNLERNASTHRLSFVQSAGGTWLLNEDHITSALHLL